jgi:hypothetical protein
MSIRNRSTFWNTSKEKLSIRLELGILQEEWAAFSGISKSLLAMIETNKREWPLGKGKTDLPLVSAYAKSMEEPADLLHLEKPESMARSQFEARLSGIRTQRFKKEKELKKMQFLLNSGRKLLQTCHRLKLEFPELDQNKQSLLALWEQYALDRISKNHEDIQAMLEMKLRHLDEEEGLILKALERFSFKTGT